MGIENSIIYGLFTLNVFNGGVSSKRVRCKISSNAYYGI